LLGRHSTIESLYQPSWRKIFLKKLCCKWIFESILCYFVFPAFLKTFVLIDDNL
jgi:hypothetical protein